MTDNAAARWIHPVAGAWIAGMLAFAHLSPASYRAAMQEDRAIEWLTVAFFLLAAVAFGARVVRERRPANAALAAFCLAAAGEEISWGQRLLGYMPPDAFLERNSQQEVNVHNLVEGFGQPKWTLIAILLSYAVLAPLALRSPALGRLHRLELALPPLHLAVWFVLAAVLLVAYPVSYTGEWIEALVGFLFLAAASPSGRWPAAGAAAAIPFALGMSALSGSRASGDPGATACARAEAEALARALSAASSPGGSRRVHRRLWSLVQRGDVRAPLVDSALASARCAGAGSASSDSRRRYAVDPWGTAYWVRVTPLAGPARLEVYSFGPNRRRDDEASGRDDIVASELFQR